MSDVWNQATNDEEVNPESEWIEYTPEQQSEGAKLTTLLLGGFIVDFHVLVILGMLKMFGVI